MLPPPDPSQNPPGVPDQARRSYFPTSSGGSKVTRARVGRFSWLSPSVARGGVSKAAIARLNRRTRGGRASGPLRVLVAAHQPLHRELVRFFLEAGGRPVVALVGRGRGA